MIPKTKRFKDAKLFNMKNTECLISLRGHVYGHVHIHIAM